MAPPRKQSQAEINFRKAETVLAQAEAAHKAGKKFSDGQVKKIGQAYEVAKKAYNEEAAGVDQRYNMVSDTVERIFPVDNDALKAVYKEFGLDAANNRSRSSSASGGPQAPARRTSSAPINPTPNRATAGRTANSPVGRPGTSGAAAHDKTTREAMVQVKKAEKALSREMPGIQAQYDRVNNQFWQLGRELDAVQDVLSRPLRGVSVSQSEVDDLMNETADQVRLSAMDAQRGRQQEVATQRLLDSAPKAPTHTPTVAAAKSVTPQPVVRAKRPAELPTPAQVKQQKVEPDPNQAKIDAAQKKMEVLVAKRNELVAAKAAPVQSRMSILKTAVEAVDRVHGTNSMAYYQGLAGRYTALERQHSKILDLEKHAKRFPRSEASADLKAAKQAYEKDKAAFKQDLTAYSDRTAKVYDSRIEEHAKGIDALKQPAAPSVEQDHSASTAPRPRGLGGRP